jgi:hypothetical protein
MNATNRPCLRLLGGVWAGYLLANVLFASNLCADNKIANATEYAQVAAVCRDLVGSQFPYDGLPWQRPWQSLLRYLPNKDALYRTPFVCSGRCSGSVQLRNGLWLNFTFLNPQKFEKQWGPFDGRIDSVQLVKGDEVIFHYEKHTH